MQWIASEDPPATKTLLEASISPRLAPLLARRGITDATSAEAFLEPSADALFDPFLLPAMTAAVERLIRTRQEGEKVCIVGDYDVDGISGTALLTATLRFCGLEVETILPNRLVDGYGFQPTHVDRARQMGCSVVLTVDCGTTSLDAVAQARSQGLDVIITDHHIPSPEMDPEVLQINPLLPECEYPFEFLSGAGLALKLAIAVLQWDERPVPLDSLLRMACLGTIADFVPLVGENRVIAALGLKALEQSRSEGLKALIRSARLRPPFRASDVGFRLAPRINAAGRLSRPDEALELLMTRSAKRATALAKELEGRNRERQETERRIVQEARELFVDLDPLPGILVGWSETWHKGVVGIAASRLAREFHRPTVLLAVEGDRATGSGRSIPGVSLHGFLEPWLSAFERFGGHEQAIGLTVRSDRLEELKKTWEKNANWPDEVLVRSRIYELDLRTEDITADLHEELNQLHPHGPGNPQPVLRLGPLELVGTPRVFGRGHIQCRAVDGTGGRVSLLGWGWQDRLSLFEHRFEILGHLEWDRYADSPVIQLRAGRTFHATDSPNFAGPGTGEPKR